SRPDASLRRCTRKWCAGRRPKSRPGFQPASRAASSCLPFAWKPMTTSWQARLSIAKWALADSGVPAREIARRLKPRGAHRRDVYDALRRLGAADADDEEQVVEEEADDDGPAT